MSDTFDHELDAWESYEDSRNEFEEDDYEDFIPVRGNNSFSRRISKAQHDTIRLAQINSTDGFWTYIKAEDWDESERNKISGKYLFFSEKKSELILIALYEIQINGFRIAKVSNSARTTDYVLCLYWEDDDRKIELAGRYGDNSRIKYRWWKSDADTRAGKYSKRFLSGY